MAVTETTTVSWGSRLSGSIKGVLFGILLFIVGFPVLFKNEGRAVTATKTNEEGAATVVEATAAGKFFQHRHRLFALKLVVIAHRDFYHTLPPSSKGVNHDANDTRAIKFLRTDFGKAPQLA